MNQGLCVDLGNVYASLGEYEKNIDYYQKGLDIIGKLGDKKGQGSTWVI